MRYSIFAVILFISLYYAYKAELTVLFSLLCEVLTSSCTTHLLRKISVVVEPKVHYCYKKGPLIVLYPAEWSISQSLSFVHFLESKKL